LHAVGITLEGGLEQVNPPGAPSGSEAPFELAIAVLICAAVAVAPPACLIKDTTDINS
jgi:hypothetical protein